MSSYEIDEDIGDSQHSSNVYQEDFSVDSDKQKAPKSKPAKNDEDEEGYKIEFENEADDDGKNDREINQNNRSNNNTNTDKSKENKNINNEKKADEREDSNKPQLEQQKLTPEQLLAQSITQEQINKQQLGFLGQFSKFVEEKNKREESLEKIREDKGEKPQQRQRKGFERSVEKKIVPSEEEIQEILDRNQQNFLQRMQGLIKEKEQKAKLEDKLNDYLNSEDENQYYDEEEQDGYDDDLQVIEEAEHEESQLDIRSSQHNSSQISDRFDEKNYLKRPQISDNYENNDDDDNHAYTLSSSLGRSPNKHGISAYSALKALKRNQIEKQFHKEVAYMSQEFSKKEKLKSINDLAKLDISVDGSFKQEEEILQIADDAAGNIRDLKKMQILQERMRYGCKKCAEQNNLKDRERLKEENLELKKLVNELTAAIQILKVQAMKNARQSMNSSFTSTESTASTAVTRRISELEFDKGKLQEHNVSLRQQLTDLKETQTSQMKREKVVKQVIQKELGKDIRALQEKENKKKIYDQELQKKLTDQTNKLCELRLDLEKMVVKYTDQKDKLKEKDSVIEELREKLKKLQFTKQLDEIAVLQAKIKKNDEENENIREEMALDNQIAELFPNSIVPIMHFLNICVGIEQLNHGKNKRLLSYLSTVIKPVFKRIRKFFRFCKDYVEVKFISKNIKEQMDQKALVRATIKAWNKSPDIVSTKMNEQYKELKEIKERSIEMSTQIEILSSQNQLLEKDIEALKSRNQVVENKLLIDKNRLIQNTIIQLKHHSIEDEESNYLEELKDVVRVIGQGVPLLYSQEQKEELKRQQAIEAEKERQQKEKEEKEAAKLLEKQKKLELKQKLKEEQEAYDKLPHCKKAPKPPSAIIINNVKAAQLKEKAFRVNSANKIKDNKQNQKNP